MFLNVKLKKKMQESYFNTGRVITDKCIEQYSIPGSFFLIGAFSGRIGLSIVTAVIHVKETAEFWQTCFNYAAVN